MVKRVEGDSLNDIQEAVISGEMRKILSENLQHVKEHADNPDAWCELGLAYENTGEFSPENARSYIYEKALESYNKALKIAPDHIKSLYVKATLIEYKGGRILTGRLKYQHTHEQFLEEREKIKREGIKCYKRLRKYEESNPQMLEEEIGCSNPTEHLSNIFQ